MTAWYHLEQTELAQVWRGGTSPAEQPRDTGAKRKCLYGVKDTMSFRVAKRGYREYIVSFAGAMWWAAKQGPDPSFR